MTDLEMTRLCAEAMGLRYEFEDDTRQRYDPLHDDAQAMQLVKRFRLSIGTGKKLWYLVLPDYPYNEIESDDLNRAIVEVVAKMQQSKVETPS